MSVSELPHDLIPIDSFARAVRRSVWTVRQWSIAGSAPNGMRLKTYRDSMTKIRYFRKADADRIAAAILCPA